MRDEQRKYGIKQLTLVETLMDDDDYLACTIQKPANCNRFRVYSSFSTLNITT
jgi:hypothetical protein